VTTVLVVDDEPIVRDVVVRYLEREGFRTLEAGDGEDARALVERGGPDLVVLDVMLPDFDGFEVARRLAAGGRNLPILFLTARDTTQDKVRGLTLGGDDYVTKPFSVEELIARVRAILRRAGVDGDASSLAFEDVELDDETREVHRAGREIELTDTEYRLLRYLMLNPRRVLSRAQILDHVWQYDFGGDARVLETYISYLRKKVDGRGPRLIHTVRGVGYVLRRPRN
jgi:two-component system, OmpR family, response regulator